MDRQMFQPPQPEINLQNVLAIGSKYDKLYIFLISLSVRVFIFCLLYVFRKYS